MSLADSKLAGDRVAQWYAAVTISPDRLRGVRHVTSPSMLAATALGLIASIPPEEPRAPAAQIDERALGFRLSAAAGARVGFHGRGGTVSVVRFDTSARLVLPTATRFKTTLAMA